VVFPYRLFKKGPRRSQAMNWPRAARGRLLAEAEKLLFLPAYQSAHVGPI
jgi:hypothetical protein